MSRFGGASYLVAVPNERTHGWAYICRCVRFPALGRHCNQASTLYGVHQNFEGVKLTFSCQFPENINTKATIVKPRHVKHTIFCLFVHGVIGNKISKQTGFSPCATADLLCNIHRTANNSKRNTTKKAHLFLAASNSAASAAALVAITAAAAVAPAPPPPPTPPRSNPGALRSVPPPFFSNPSPLPYADSPRAPPPHAPPFCDEDGEV